MVYESRVGDVFALGATSWRIEEITSRSGAGLARVRAAGARAVLEGRRARAAGRARRGDRGVHARAGVGADRARAEATAPDRGSRARRTGRAQPRGVRRRAEAGDRRRADRHHARGRAVPRRARRLAARAAFPVRHACARAVGAGGHRAHPRAARRRRIGDGGRRRHRGAAARDGCRTARRGPLPLRCRRSSTSWSPPRSAARRCSRRASASPRRAPCCCRATTPVAARRSGSSGSAAPSCSRSRASTRASRSSSRRCARCCRTSTTCPPSSALTAEDREPRKVRLVEVETESPSPFARTLLFGYVAAFMYEGDSPLAERRAAALSPRPDPARRAARPRRAARTARPGRHRADRDASCSASHPTAGEGRRGSRRSAAHAGPAVDGGAGRAFAAA